MAETSGVDFGLKRVLVAAGDAQVRRLCRDALCLNGCTVELVRSHQQILGSLKSSG